MSDSLLTPQASPAAPAAQLEPSAPAAAPAPEVTSPAPDASPEAASSEAQPAVLPDPHGQPLAPVQAEPSSSDSAAPEPPAPEVLPDPDPVLSETEPEQAALSPEQVKAFYDALPPHEKARLIGVPEDYIQEGQFYHDPRDGHFKGDDPEQFFRSRAVNDQYAATLRQKEQQLVAARDEALRQVAELQATTAQQQAHMEVFQGLKAGPDGKPDVDAFAGYFIDEFLPDEIKGVTDPNVIDDADLVGSWYEARANAKHKARQMFEESEQRATEQVEAQKAYIERGQQFVTEKVTGDALGATTIDQQGAIATLLMAPIGDEGSPTWEDALRTVGGLHEAIGDELLFAFKVKAHALVGSSADATPKPAPAPASGNTPPAPSAAPAATAPAAPVPAAPVQEEVVTVTSNPVTPTPPPGSPPPQPKNHMESLAQGRKARKR